MENHFGAWAALLILGAYHGINPGMGWLFAVALGMQDKSSRAVGRSLVPIALGHGLSIGAVVITAGFAQTFIAPRYIRIPVSAILFTLGLYRLARKRHPRWVGMRVGFRDLTLWSFLMASAHGAGLMLLPVLFGIAAPEHFQHLPHAQAGSAGALSASLLATLIHTFGYLVVMGIVAFVVYEKLGLALLRKAWLNLDLVWSMVLMFTGCLTAIL
jgi:hypothetical protein